MGESVLCVHVLVWLCVCVSMHVWLNLSSHSGRVLGVPAVLTNQPPAERCLSCGHMPDDSDVDGHAAAAYVCECELPLSTQHPALTRVSVCASKFSKFKN